MKYRIVVDSCCDIYEGSPIMKVVKKVPLTLTVDKEDIIDDENFDQKLFLQKVAAYKEASKSSCPSPQAYMEAYEGDFDCVFVVTLSGNLSGSYNSAVVGKDMYYEEHENSVTKIHVFDSCSASIGEERLATEIFELAESGADFEEIVKKATDYRNEMKTYFVIETLETLRKNGRLSNLKAIFANVLNIKPVMSATDDGVIIKLDQARGMEKALHKMIEYIVEKTKNIEEKVLAIGHCNCYERALWVKDEILKLANFKSITISNTGGVSTLYANDGGIIIAV